MKVVYELPKDLSNYRRWFDNNGTFDIWYEEETMIFDYKKMQLPQELVLFLDKWCEKMAGYKEAYVELYPVKLAHIEFIYKDFVYIIYPTTIGATYRTNFLSDEYYDVSWDSLFETYQREIRDDMKKELGIIHSRYYGFLD